MYNITVIGVGYVGLVTGVGLASLGHNIICYDNDSSKIDLLNSGKIPIYEPGISETIDSCIKSKKLSFSNDINQSISRSSIIFLAVGTPDNEDGSVNLYYINNALNDIIDNLDKDIILAVKSTVPVGTNESISKNILDRSLNYKIDIVSNPEFLREGFALYDFFNPARIIIGSKDADARDIIKDIYNRFAEENIPIILTDPNSAELSKYASNAFLATKIAFINEMADLCESYGGDIEEVTKIMGLDDRIGSKFLKPSPGFGGSCFPKDSLAIRWLAENVNQKFNIISSVITANNNRKHNMINKINNILDNFKSISKTVTCLGASFKANTDDIRESPAINIIKLLIKENYIVNLYDPVSINNAKSVLMDSVNYYNNIKDASKDSIAIIILTEWQEFADFDYSNIKDLMNENIVIDLRNILDAENIEKIGFKYHRIGVK